MFFSNDRQKLRQTYFDIWQKTLNKQPLEPLETLISEVIAEHPEYHPMFQDKNSLHKDFFAEAGQDNPFLHMGLHLAIREQIATNRPQSILSCYNNLCVSQGGSHEAEHRMMECLAEMIWSAQKNNKAPDEQAYMACLNKISENF